MARHKTLYPYALLAFVVVLLAPHAAHAQRVEVEAYAGRPWGVARISLPPNHEANEIAELNGFALTQSDGRVLYPVFTTGKLLKVLGGILGLEGEPAPALQVLFLFRGADPFRVKLYGPQPVEVEVIPRSAPPRAHDRLLQRWWRDYYGLGQKEETDGDVPPVVHAYLTSMLSRRLNLAPPAGPLANARRSTDRSSSSEVAQALELLAGVERLRTETLRKTMLSDEDLGRDATEPVPSTIRWTSQPAPPFDENVKIEPLALRVPHDCLYIRFGKYANYLWFNQLLKDYGGEIGNMATQRALATHKDERMQQQLALPPVAPGGSSLADLLGEAAIADMALIGRDMYLDEGASMGVLFQARTSLLGVKFNQNRREIANREKDTGATLENVIIANKQVSFLSTPDNRLRSYYVVDGDFHLVTTSRTVVEEFLAVAAEQLPPLGILDEFKHARTRLPLDRNDTLFAYFSSGFFRGLAEPQYQIETARRLRASTDLQLIALAQLAAHNEGVSSDDFDDLIVAGLLPNGFGRRPDGSGPLQDGNRWIDSLRGAPGFMLPVADVALQRVTAAEARACAARAAYFEANWKQMDPLMVAARREPLDHPGLERILVAGHVSPLDDSKYGKFLSLVGPPVTERIAPVEGDAISVQAYLRGGLVMPQIPPHLMFLGIQDLPALSDPRAPGLLQTLRLLQSTPGYLGAWPKPGFLDLLPFNLGGGRNVDPLGYSKIPLGWRRQWDAFSAVAADRQVLASVTPQLQVVPTDDPAQIRIHVSNLAGTKLASWVNGLYYQRARDISRGNVRLLHALSQQLGVPRQDALDTAQRILNAELYCPLHGDYELAPLPGGLNAWRSSRWPNSPSELVPADYQSPILEWFRGIDSGLIKQDSDLKVHAELIMQRRK